MSTQEKKFNPTPAQVSVIQSDAETLLVSASAGCGKTTVMIEKIVSLIMSGVPLSSTVVCTFTKSAATDMRAKLYNSLSKLALCGSEAAKNALKELPSAQISTLHSFCQQLIKTYFYAVDTDPNFDILSEHDAKTYLSIAIEKTVERFYNDTQNPNYDDFILMYQVLLKRRKPEHLYKLIKDLYLFAFVQPDPIHWLDSCMDYCECHQELLSCLDGVECVDLSEVKDPINTKRFAKLLAQMAKDAGTEYKKEKLKKSVLDYSDLEHFALEILSDRTASEQIAAKYKYLFVDEYQDINPIQEKIISLIKARKFFVGDVKQSIYGFRLCDPDIFVEKYRTFKKGGGGKAIDLNSNFRSKPQILKFCNDVFSRAMTADFGKVDFKNDAAFDFSEDEPKSYNDNVKILLAVKDKKQAAEFEDIYSVREHSFEDEQDGEAGLVVSRVLDLIASGSKFCDIAILLRSLNNPFAKNLCKKLKAASIPVFSSEKKRADDCVDNNVLLSYLRLIDNHNDDISLASVMRSCFGGFSDEDMAAIRQNFREGFFYEAVRAGLNNKEFYLSERLKAFFERLDYLTEVSKSVKVSALAGIICAGSDYFKYILAQRDGLVKAKELAAFLDEIEASAFNTSLYDFIRTIDKNMPEIEVKAEGDCVRVMTIHASKGLEFEHVILANANHLYNTKDTSGVMLLDAEYGIGLKNWNVGQKTLEDTSLYLKIKNKLMQKTLEEEMRVLYVALTRAKTTLTITATVSNNELKVPEPQKAKCYLDIMASEAAANGEFVSYEDCGLIESDIKTNILYREPDPSLLAKIKEYTDFVYKTSSRPVKMSVSAIISEDNASESETDGVVLSPYVDMERAAAIGNAYHKIMQEINFENPFEDEFVRFCNANDSIAHYLKKYEVEKAYYQIKDIIKDRKYYRELPFIMQSDDGVLVQGIIDLCIKHNNGYEIIDYKTGKVESEAKEKYAKQLSLYAQAIGKILKQPVIKKSLYVFSRGSFEVL